jgi:phage gp36-like protein
MAYCSQSDIEKLLPPRELAELTADSGDLPDIAVIAACITKAEAEIDAYLGQRYEVPLAVLPAAVASWAVDVAIYHLYSRRSAVPAVREERYRRVLAFLREVAAGTAVLGSEGAELPRRRESGAPAEVAAAPRVFHRDGLRDF